MISQIYSVYQFFTSVASSSLDAQKNRREEEEGCRFPWPKIAPLLGNLRQLGKLPHQSLWKLSQNSGGFVFGDGKRTHGDSRSRFLLQAPTRSPQHLLLQWRRRELFALRRVQSFRHAREEEISLLLDTIARSSSESCQP